LDLIWNLVLGYWNLSSDLVLVTLSLSKGPSLESSELAAKERLVEGKNNDLQQKY
jgi:hypothetical protein